MITPTPADEEPELVVIPYDPDLSVRRYAALMGRAVLDEMIGAARRRRWHRTIRRLRA